MKQADLVKQAEQQQVTFKTIENCLWVMLKLWPRLLLSKEEIAKIIGLIQKKYTSQNLKKAINGENTMPYFNVNLIKAFCEIPTIHTALDKTTREIIEEWRFYFYFEVSPNGWEQEKERFKQFIQLFYPRTLISIEFAPKLCEEFFKLITVAFLNKRFPPEVLFLLIDKPEEIFLPYFDCGDIILNAGITKLNYDPELIQLTETFLGLIFQPSRQPYNLNILILFKKIFPNELIIKLLNKISFLVTADFLTAFLGTSSPSTLNIAAGLAQQLCQYPVLFNKLNARDTEIVLRSLEQPPERKLALLWHTDKPELFFLKKRYYLAFFKTSADAIEPCNDLPALFTALAKIKVLNLSIASVKIGNYGPQRSFDLGMLYFVHWRSTLWLDNFQPNADTDFDELISNIQLSIYWLLKKETALTNQQFFYMDGELEKILKIKNLPSNIAKTIWNARFVLQPYKISHLPSEAKGEDTNSARIKLVQEAMHFPITSSVNETGVIHDLMPKTSYELLKWLDFENEAKVPDFHKSVIVDLTQKALSSPSQIVPIETIWLVKFMRVSEVRKVLKPAEKTVFFFKCLNHIKDVQQQKGDLKEFFSLLSQFDFLTLLLECREEENFEELVLFFAINAANAGLHLSIFEKEAFVQCLKSEWDIQILVDRLSCDRTMTPLATTTILNHLFQLAEEENTSSLEIIGSAIPKSVLNFLTDKIKNLITSDPTRAKKYLVFFAELAYRAAHLVQFSINEVFFYFKQLPLTSEKLLALFLDRYNFLNTENRITLAEIIINSEGVLKDKLSSLVDFLTAKISNEENIAFDLFVLIKNKKIIAEDLFKVLHSRMINLAGLIRVENESRKQIDKLLFRCCRINIGEEKPSPDTQNFLCDVFYTCMTTPSAFAECSGEMKELLTKNKELLARQENVFEEKSPGAKTRALMQNQMQLLQLQWKELNDFLPQTNKDKNGILVPAWASALKHAAFKAFERCLYEYTHINEKLDFLELGCHFQLFRTHSNGGLFKFFAKDLTNTISGKDGLYGIYCSLLIKPTQIYTYEQIKNMLDKCYSEHDRIWTVVSHLINKIRVEIGLLTTSGKTVPEALRFLPQNVTELFKEQKGSNQELIKAIPTIPGYPDLNAVLSLLKAVKVFPELTDTDRSRELSR